MLPEGRQRPIDRVTAMLRYRSVACLQILWTVEDLSQWGLPVDRPDCVVLLEASLDERWHGVVAERAREVVTPRNPAEAVRLLEQRADAESIPV